MDQKQRQIEQQALEALESVEGMERAEARPFLYTRIRQRMENRLPESMQWLPAVLSRPFLVYSFIALVVVLNLTIGFTSLQRTNAVAENNQEMVEQDMATEYASSKILFTEFNPDSK